MSAILSCSVAWCQRRGSIWPVGGIEMAPAIFSTKDTKHNNYFGRHHIDIKLSLQGYKLYAFFYMRHTEKMYIIQPNDIKLHQNSYIFHILKFCQLYIFDF